MRRQTTIKELKAKSLETRGEQVRGETVDEYFCFVDGKLIAYQFKINAPAPAP